MVRNANPMDDPVLLRAKINALERRCVDLEIERDLAKQHAVNWEHTAKALRKELNARRQNCTTERISRKHQ